MCSHLPPDVIHLESSTTHTQLCHNFLRLFLKHVWLNLVRLSVRDQIVSNYFNMPNNFGTKTLNVMRNMPLT